MTIKNSLVGLVGSALIAGSTLLGSCLPAYAQKDEVYETKHTLQIGPQKTRDSKEIPVKLFQYQQHNQKLVSSGETILPIEADMDYQTGQLRVSYSSGRMTDEGPDLSRFSNNERDRLQGTQLVPRLNDSHTLAVVVSSSSESVGVKQDGQMAWLMGANENPTRLIPSSDKIGDKIFLYAGNEGIDSLVEWGAVQISGGLSEGWDEAVDLLGVSDKYKINASERARKFFEGLRDKEIARQEGHAESSLERGVSMGILDLYKDPRPGPAGRHMVARSIDLILENKTFDEQEVALVFNQIRLGEKASQDVVVGTSSGSKFGDVRDVAVKVKLPGREDLNNCYGVWKGERGIFKFSKSPQIGMFLDPQGIQIAKYSYLALDSLGKIPIKFDFSGRGEQVLFLKQTGENLIIEREGYGNYDTLKRMTGRDSDNFKMLLGEGDSSVNLFGKWTKEDFVLPFVSGEELKRRTKDEGVFDSPLEIGNAISFRGKNFVQGCSRIYVSRTKIFPTLPYVLLEGEYAFCPEEGKEDRSEESQPFLIKPVSKDKILFSFFVGANLRRAFELDNESQNPEQLNSEILNGLLKYHFILRRVAD